jgi:transposase
MGEVFVGHDWAEDHHDIHVQDSEGRQLAKARLADGVEGIAKFHALLAEHVEDPAEVVIASETDRGLFVGALIAAGYRCCGQPGLDGEVSDPALDLGCEVRSGGCEGAGRSGPHRSHNHRPVAGDSELAEAIKTLARAHQGLVWTRQRQTNQLRSTLREFYPAALDAFPELASSDALAVLRIAPTPEQGRRLSRSKIAAALRRGGRQRNIDKRTHRDPDRATHRAARSTDAGRGDAMGTVVSSLVAVIATLQTQIGELEQQLGEHFEAHPDAKIIRSLPGLGMILGARVLAEFGDDPNRYDDAKCRKNYAGTSPITKASGKHRVVLARYARNKRLADACYQWAFASPSPQAPAPEPSTTNDAPQATPTTAPYARSATGSWASSTAASDTKPSTTNTPPGHTAPPSPLDTYDRGISRCGRTRPSAWEGPAARRQRSAIACRSVLARSWSVASPSATTCISARMQW